jgi:hypothetical protein
MMRILNAELIKPNDLRTGKHSILARTCRTPYGTFRSVAIARDVIMTQHPGFWMDLVGEWRITKEDIARRVYHRIYQRCKRNDGGWQLL